MKAFIGFMMVVGISLSAEPSLSATKTILDTKSFWRSRLTYGTDQIRLKSGKLIYYGGRNKNKKRKEYEVTEADAPTFWGTAPKDWHAPEFDDSSWGRIRCPIGTGDFTLMPCIYLRGKFRVTDPPKTGKLNLTVTYQGGIVVFLNGKDILRSHMPDGEITSQTPADDYPLEAFLDEKGSLHKRKSKIEQKNRQISVEIPAGKLIKGVNVLAVAVHRAPAPEQFYTAKCGRFFKPKHVSGEAWWSRCGLVDLKLTGGNAEQIIPNAGHTGRPKGFQVWTQPAHTQVYASSYVSPEETLLPIRLHGPKNGVLAIQIVTGSSESVKGLKADVTDLKGPGLIGRSAIQLRYTQRISLKSGARFFGTYGACGLENTPPKEIKRTGSLGAVQPIWLTVQVPADAKSGDYTGKVTISADGVSPRTVDLNLQVVDWKLPDPTEFQGFLGLIQSPESVAMYYDVPLWSDKHWALLEKTFSVLREVGNKTLYITAQRKTHFGNEHSMIRYRKNADGTYEPDLSIAEKYIDTAVKYLGKIPVIGVCAWRPPWSTGHYANHKTKDHLIEISVIDPKTGALKEATGPAWGTPECQTFWKPVFDGMKKIVKKHGMSESLLIGMSSDYMPTDLAVNDLKIASGGLKWIHHSHVIRNQVGEKVHSPMRYIAAGWGGHTSHVNPPSRGYGWKNPILRVETRQYPSSMIRQRFVLEHNMTSIAKKNPHGVPKDVGVLDTRTRTVKEHSNTRLVIPLIGKSAEELYKTAAEVSAAMK